MFSLSDSSIILKGFISKFYRFGLILIALFLSPVYCFFASTLASDLILFYGSTSSSTVICFADFISKENFYTYLWRLSTIFSANKRKLLISYSALLIYFYFPTDKSSKKLRIEL